MFLVTTADRRFWKRDGRILFLGEWCRLYRERADWEGLDADVLPYHWDDRRRFHRDYLEGREAFARTLPALASRLNALHGVTHSTRYWHILVGWWLTYFVDILLDRYQSVCAARDSGRVTGTWIEDVPPGAWTAQDFAEFHHWFTWDPYNHVLYGDLIRLDGAVPFEMVSVPPASCPPPIPAESASPWKRGLKRALWAYARAIPSRRNAVVAVESHLSHRNLYRLQRALGQWPSPTTRLSQPYAYPFDAGMRQALEIPDCATAFERALVRLIPAHLPRVYVEGYHDARRRALALFPRRPRVIFTANSYSSYEPFKFWAAEKVDEGAALGIWQHGGTYGTSRWSSNEQHETAICDRFYSWGWTPQPDTRSAHICLGRLNDLGASLVPDPTGGILWTGFSALRYAYLLYSSPTGPQILAHLDDQRRFYDGLPPEVRRLIVLRLYPYDYGWHERDRWRDWAPDLRVTQGGETMYEQLRRHRLMIATYNSTTYLETFAAGYPTLLFWDPRQWELRPEAQPYFDLLQDAGIYHDTPESAAAKVAEIHDDPQRWWQSPAVRSARQRFGEHFVKTSPAWMRDLARDLTTLGRHATGPARPA